MTDRTTWERFLIGADGSLRSDPAEPSAIDLEIMGWVTPTEQEIADARRRCLAALGGRSRYKMPDDAAIHGLASAIKLICERPDPGEVLPKPPEETARWKVISVLTDDAHEKLALSLRGAMRDRMEAMANVAHQVPNGHYDEAQRSIADLLTAIRRALPHLAGPEGHPAPPRDRWEHIANMAASAFRYAMRSTNKRPPGISRDGPLVPFVYGLVKKNYPAPAITLAAVDQHLRRIKNGA